MSHGDLKDFFGVEILEHCMDKYAKNEQRRLLWWKNEARRQEQRGAENFSAIEIAPKISQITGLYCSKIRTFTQGPGARCLVFRSSLFWQPSASSISWQPHFSPQKSKASLMCFRHRIKRHIGQSSWASLSILKVILTIMMVCLFPQTFG